MLYNTTTIAHLVAGRIANIGRQNRERDLAIGSGAICLKPSTNPTRGYLLIKDARDADEQENVNVLDMRPESSITKAP